MRRATPVTVALLLVVSTLAAVPVATMAQETATDAEPAAGNATAAPGAQLSGVVGVQGAEIGGDVQSRTYGLRVAQANTDAAKAAVVAEQLTDSRQRLAELERRKQSLDRARANGSMTAGEYRAKVARLHAETRTVERLVGQANETAGRLPAAALERKGVDAAAIRTLAQRANELSGPEVAAIARAVAGPGVGEQARPDGAGERTAVGGNRTASDRTADPAGDGPQQNATDRRPDAETTSTDATTNSTDRPSSGGQSDR
ncbi:hypothetical protein [Haloarcula salina]|uniref:Uncharacterized protein n=1 Tax=Haloarcula salina TaxID=1429914 RepID=A0AA41G133_9EURY|nr:hypothetical protein [Haloarcula salina]MBV0902301.1 hypothetical protein [Haloarcula salina]